MGPLVLPILLAGIQAGTVVVPKDAVGEPIRIQCPVHRVTKVVFPEAMRQLKSLGEGGLGLGLSVERTKPQGVLAVSPRLHPASGTVEFRGPTMVIRVTIESAPEEDGSELHVGVKGSGGATEVQRPIEPAPAPSSQGPPPTPPRSDVPSPITPALDLQGLLNATPIAVDRREGLPGHPEMVLVDALHGDKWIWLRFRLEGGAQSRIDRVFWEHGEIATYVQDLAGKDLRIVVQIPKDRVSKKTRVSLEVASGPVYKFALNPSTLTHFFKDLFK